MFHIFKDGSRSGISSGSTRCNWSRYKEGIVVDYEDESSDVYFIISGEVRILIRTSLARKSF